MKTRITDNYFIGGPLDGVRNTQVILGNYFEWTAFGYDTVKMIEGLPQEAMDVKVKYHTHLYQRHHEFSHIFIYQGQDLPGMVKVEKNVVMKAIENFYGSEYLYDLRSSRSQLLREKAHQLMVEADEYYNQANRAEVYGYCGEKLLDIVKEYGEDK